MSVSDTSVRFLSSLGATDLSTAINFEFEDNSQIEVTLRDETETVHTETLLALTTDYTLVGSDPVTGISLVVALTATQRALIRRVSVLTQSTSYQSSGVFPAESHETALDRLVQIIQEHAERGDRAATWPKSSPDALSNALPEPVADAFLRVNSSGTGWEFAAQEGVTLGAQTKFAIANNTSSVADITGFLYDKTVFKAVSISYDIERRTDDSDVAESGIIYLRHNTETDGWSISVSSVFGDANVTLSVTSAGQVQYTSTNQTGDNYAGYIRFFNLKELVQ